MIESKQHSKQQQGINNYIKSFNKQGDLNPYDINVQRFSIGDDDQEIQQIVSCHIDNDFSIKLHNQNIMADDKQMSQASTISIISEALTQRKADNFSQISNYMKKHIEYCIPHMNVLLQIEGQISIRVTNSKVTVKSIIDYLSQLKFCYQNWKSHMIVISKKQSKIDNDLGYPQIKSAVRALFSVPKSLIDSADSFCNYMKNECLMQIEDSLDMYSKSLECYTEQITCLKKEADKYLRLMYRKFVIIQALMARGTTKGYDIVFEELNFIEYCNEANSMIKEWGKMINYYWKSAQKNEVYLMKVLKTQVINCFKNLQKVNFTFPKNESILAIWQNIQPQQDTAGVYSLSLLTSKQQQDFIDAHISNKQLTQTCKFQQFISMQDFLNKSAKLSTILQKLILKRFYCHLQISSESDSSPVQIVSTIDGCIVFILPPFKGYTKMQITSITSERINGCTISITQKRKGIIKTSWNRQVVKFKNQDEADQFQIFLAPTVEQRDSILI